MNKLEEIKEKHENHYPLGDIKDRGIIDEDVDWLIEQAEKVKLYEDTLDDLEASFDDFAKITGDSRFVYQIRRAKSRFNVKGEL